MRWAISYLLYSLKSVKNNNGGVLLKPATLLKVTLLHDCFSRLLNCTNGTKSRNAMNNIGLIGSFSIKDF